MNGDREEDTSEQRHEALIERRAEFNEKENQIMEKLVEELSKESTEQPQNLRGIDRRRLKCASEKVDRVLQHVTLRMETLKQLNNILKAVGNAVAWLDGEKKEKRRLKERTMVEKTHSRESRLVRMKEMKLGNPQLVKILR